MTVKFSPNGFLDCASDPSDLPATAQGKNEISGAMRRCKNMYLDRTGMAVVRDGLAKASSTQMAVAINLIVEHEASRYEFGTDVHKNEASIGTGYADAQWSAMQSNAYNTTELTIYALNGTDRIKIEDGYVSEWGITAPTTPPSCAFKIDKAYLYDWEKALQMVASTAIDECDAVTDWAESPTKGTLSVNTTRYKESTGSVQSYWAQDLTSTDKVFSLTKTFSAAQDWSSYDYIQFWLYRDDQYPSKVSTNVVIVKDSSGTTLYTFPLSLPNDAQWSLITLDLVSTGEDFSDVAEFVIQRTYSTKHFWSMYLNVDYLVGFGLGSADIAYKITTVYGTSYEYLYDWEKDQLDDEDDFSSDVVSRRICYWFELGDDYVDEDVQVKYTWLRKSDDTVIAESNPSGAILVKPHSALYVAWPAPSDTQVTHVRIYRTEVGGTEYYYDIEANATDLTACCHRLDTELATTIPSNHDRPPTGSICVGPMFNGVCFIADNNFLYYCLAKQPEYWPALYYVQVSPYDWPIKALSFWNGFLYAITETEIYQIQGTGAASFFPVAMGAASGAKTQESVCSVPGVGIFHWWDLGVYLFNGRDDVKITEERFAPIFRGTETNSMKGLNTTYLTNCIIKYFNGKVYFFYPGGTATYCNCALVMDTATKKTVYYEWSQEWTAVGIDYTNRRMLATSSDFYCYIIENPSYTDDNGTAITWEIESKAYSDQLYRYFPRYARYDVELESGSTATGYVLLEDSSVQSHTISSRSTKKRLITSANGIRLGIRISGSGPAKVYAAEVE